MPTPRAQITHVPCRPHSTRRRTAEERMPTVVAHVARLLALALFVAAQPGLARAADYEAAKKKYLSGQKAYAEKSYDRAVEDYKAAYEAGKDPAIYFNLAEAYEKLGDATNAV